MAAASEPTASQENQRRASDVILNLSSGEREVRKYGIPIKVTAGTTRANPT
ncbi:hypothetical protein PILCRDRAFT_826912, partial [Piloderma croceum F 1598]